MNNTNIPVILPGGFWVDGRCYREVELRPLTGDDETFLLEVGETLFPAQRTTALLTRCLTRLGELTLVTTEAVRSLTVGNREALLLHLRRLTLGDRLQCVLNCSNPDCGEKMDLDIKASEMLLSPYPQPKEWYEMTVKENGVAYRVQFRLPNGGDQEVTAALAHSQPQAAVEMLLRRCVKQVIPADEEGDRIEEWPSAVIQQLPAVMADLDPQAELMLNLNCPVCDHPFSALFDTATYFFQELAGRMRHLYREVHLLAFYYHWSEREIMQMTTRKRRRYLEILEEAVTKKDRER